MKKIALMLFFASLMQEGISQIAWDSLGVGLPSSTGVNRIWKIKDRVFSSESSLTTDPLQEYSQNSWNTFITSSTGQILDLVFDSVNDKAIILGKFSDLSGPVNSITCSAIAVLDLSTDSIFSLGAGVNYASDYAYQGIFVGGDLIIVGRFQIVMGTDTITNILRIDSQTGQYFSVSNGNQNDLVRKILVFNGDTIVSGSFIRNGQEFPLAKITGTTLDFSISGSYRGFAQDMIVWNDKLIFSGNIYDVSSVQYQYLIGSYNGISYQNLGRADGLVKTIKIWKGDLFIGGEFNLITDSLGLSISANRIASFQNTWSDVVGGCQGIKVNYLYSTPDTLYVAGKFFQSGQIWTQNVSILTTLSFTGVSEESSNTYPRIFPNPSDGNFTIFLDNYDRSHIQILDLSGRKVYEEFNAVLPKVIQVDLPNGFYVLKVNDRLIKFVIRK